MMRLRQIVLVARDLDERVADARVLLGQNFIFEDAAVGTYGLTNAVFPIGETFLEIISPREPGTSAGRLLKKRRRDGGYMIIVEVTDADAARARVLSAGARIVDQRDYADATFTHVHPRDVGGAMLSLDTMKSGTDWKWGGPDWRRHCSSGFATAILAAELQAEDPAALAARWSEVLGRSAQPRGQGRWVIQLDAGAIFFVPRHDALADSLSAIVLAAKNPEAIRDAGRKRGLSAAGQAICLAGVRIQLVDESQAPFR